MLEHYKTLLNLKCFSIADATPHFITEQKTHNILYTMKKEGLIQSVRRDLYVAISLETNESVATPFEIATHVTEDSYISYHSAFEFYGLTNQVFSNVYASSERKFRDFNFDNQNYYCMVSKNTFGISEQKSIRVTDIERTVLDSIKDFDKIGGLEELLRCVSMITVINEEKLICYLEKYQNQFLVQKTGYFLSHFRHLKLSKTFFNYCRHHKGNSSRYLYHDLMQSNSQFIKEWDLCVPENLMNFIDIGGNEIV